MGDDQWKKNSLTSSTTRNCALTISLKRTAVLLRATRGSCTSNYRGCPGEWKRLSLDGDENNGQIASAVREAGSRISDLVILYVGMLDWRGERRLMAYGQYFRSGYDDGLLFGSHLTRNLHTEALQRSGGFLMLGACENIWMSHA